MNEMDLLFIVVLSVGNFRNPEILFSSLDVDLRLTNNCPLEKDGSLKQC